MTLETLRSACSRLCDSALSDLSVDLAARVAVGAVPFVTVSFEPAAAAVFVEVPGVMNAEPFMLRRFVGAELPRELGEAAAAYLTETLSTLDPERQTQIARAMRANAGRLALLLNTFPTADCSVLLYADGPDPIVVHRVYAAETQVH